RPTVDGWLCIELVGERHRSHNDALFEAIRPFGRPTCHQRDDLMVSGCDKARICSLLLRRYAFFIEYVDFLDDVQVLLAFAIQCDLIADLDVVEIFEHLAVATHVPREHNVIALAWVARTAMLTNCVFGHLPNRHLLAIQLLHLPTHFDHFRIDVDAGDHHTGDGGLVSGAAGIGHGAAHKPFVGRAAHVYAEVRRGEGGRLVRVRRFDRGDD